MAIDIFEPLKDLQGNKQKSASWYRNAVSLIADKSSPSELFASGKLLGRPSAGRMSMFSMTLNLNKDCHITTLSNWYYH